MRKDTERVLTVLLALALALLAITAFALARAHQRIRLNEIANGTHETVSGSAAYWRLDEQASQIQKVTARLEASKRALQVVNNP